MTTKLGSVLLGTSNVSEMKQWYETAFAVKPNEMGAYDFGGVQLFVEEHSEVKGDSRDPARAILNLDVDNCRALEDHLVSLSVNWVRPVEQMPFGLIGTLTDPDGNYLQIIQWGANPEAHRD